MLAFLKTRWRAVVGYLSFVTPIIYFASWVIDWLRRIDFIATHMNDMRAAWEMVLAPPPWLVPILIAAGFVFIRWDSRRARERNLVPVLGSAPLDHTAPQRMSLLDLRAKAIGAGWPTYLDDARWLKFLDQLRQAASDGTVAMWGRRDVKLGAAAIYRKKEDYPREPLVRIPQDHWATFKIDWNSGRQETYARSYDPSKSDWGLSAGRYADLHVGASASEWLATTKVPPA